MIAESFKIVIPARLGSTRLPRKALQPICGRPLIQHVYENARRAAATDLVVATDSAEIAACVQSIGGEVCMTSPRHRCGAERIAEAAETRAWNEDCIIINAQGDELFIEPADIAALAANLRHGAPIATLATELSEAADLNDPAIVKVVCDRRNMAMYFSRAAIPYGAALSSLRHVGVYAYRVADLKRLARLASPPMEAQESLEQLRALFHGMAIHVGRTSSAAGLGVDTAADLKRAERLLAKRAAADQNS